MVWNDWLFGGDGGDGGEQIYVWSGDMTKLVQTRATQYTVQKDAIGGSNGGDGGEQIYVWSGDMTIWKGADACDTTYSTGRLMNWVVVWLG